MNMFRCHSLVWVTLVWTSLFSYTLMAHMGTHHVAKTAALVGAIAISVVGAGLLIYQEVAKHTKIILWFCSWVVAVLLGMVFFTEEYISDLALNLWVTVVSAVAALFWCVVSHADKITEPGLHWYVWSMFTLVVLCSVFNNTTSQAIAVYILNCVLSTVINVAYLIHICRRQAQNSRRCRQLTRVSTCFAISLLLLVGSVLQKTDTISNDVWNEYVLAVQVCVFLAFIIDGIIGFSQNDYKQVANMPNDDV